VFPNVEVRHLHAVIALGEELNFTKAALRLNLTQSALSRQITEIEKQLRFRLFTRDNRRVVRVELTDAGRVFVEEARSSISHMERAFHLARATHDGAGNVLTIGHSHEADQAWISDILGVRLPLYPKLAMRLISQFSIELVRSVLAGELNLALVTAPPKDSQIEASPFVLTPIYAVLPESHATAEKEQLVLQDLAKDEWILFARRVHPIVHDAIMEAARREGIAPKRGHDIITPQEAVHLVSEHVGVAILTKTTALPLELPISRPTAGHIEYGPCIKRTGAEMDESGANNSLLIKADDRRLGKSGLKTAIQHRIGVRVFSFFARAACD
jgi:DNA-binding transcriptional LysR family regulator